MPQICKSRRYSDIKCVLVSVVVLLPLIHRSAPLLATDTVPRLWKCEERNADHIVWTLQIGASCGPVSLHNNRLLFGTTAVKVGKRGRIIDRNYGGSVWCVDSRSGKLLWQSLHTRRGRPGYERPSIGVRSQPVVKDSLVYYVSNRGELMCLDLAGFHDGRNDGVVRNEVRSHMLTADVVWKLDMVTKFGIHRFDSIDGNNPCSTPLVVGDLVYCITGNGCSYEHGGRYKRLVPAPKAPAFVAVDRRNGKVKWTSTLPGGDTLFQWSSPVLIKEGNRQGIVFPGGNGLLYCLSPTTGELLWKLDCNKDGSTVWTKHKCGSRGFFVAKPLVIGSMIYTSLNQLDGMRDGTSWPLLGVKWSLQKRVGAAQVKWRCRSKAYVGGSYSELLYDKGIIYNVCERTTAVVAVDAASGEEYWRADLGDSPAGLAAPVAKDGLVFVPSLASIHIFHVGKKKRYVGKFTFARRVCGTPVIDGEMMYVPTGTILMAIDLTRLRPKLFTK